MPKPNVLNISSVVKQGLCMGCGVCQDACKHNAIHFEIINGKNRPIVDTDKCIDCSLCFKTCAGRGIDILKIQNELFRNEKIKTDNLIGRYLVCYEGWSLDHEIRYHGASGGMVTQMLIYLLEEGYIDGAVITGFRQDNPLRPKVYIARTKEEIFAGRSSKYCMVCFSGIADEIIKTPGRYVIVGLPCHIHAFRKYEKLNRKFKDSIFGYFALYCSATKTYNSINYMMWRYNINTKEIGSFTYRDDGCMGYMKILDKKQKIIFKKKYLSYYLPLRGFFTPMRCSLCVDHYGELADVCFGDTKTGNNAETIGESTLVVRNESFLNIIEKATQSGAIYIKEISPEFLNSTQGYAYKHKKGLGIQAAFAFRRFFIRPLPHYDINIQNTTSIKYNIREIRNYICRFIGNHRTLWYIIKWLDNY